MNMEGMQLSDYRQLKKEYNRKSFKKILKEELGHKCANCSSETDIEYHHIVPLALGGTNRITNIVPLCSECHEIAHGSVKIRQICKPIVTGRKRLPLPENYKDILWKYFYGEIGKSECETLLSVNGASKLNDRPFFREFIQENNIASYENKIDTYKRFPASRKSGKLLSKVTFIDGTEKVKYI